MKVVRFGAFGTPQEVAECVDLPDPGAPGDHEVVVEIDAFPINPADLLTFEGRYAVRPPLPATLGAEGVGRVAAAGSAVDQVAVGDRVIHLGRDNWTQRIKVAADQVIKVPAEADVLQLAMLKVNPATALLMLRNYVSLKAGDWVIQNAANSGVGTCLIRHAKAAGLRTVNVVRREDLVGPLTAIGADAVVVDGDDLGKQVAGATDGAAVLLAIDAVGGEACLRLADCLVEGGTVVNYGLLSGRPCMLGSHHTIFKDITLTGFWLSRVLRTAPRAEIDALYADLAGRVRDGSLHVEVEATYPIEQIKEAVAHAGRPGRGGKVLVTPNGPIG